jgi:hypothetical protein
MEDAKNLMTKSQTQGLVLEELQGKEQRPSDLLENLTSQGYPSLEIKRVLTRLLDEQLIELTSQRMLRLR